MSMLKTAAESSLVAAPFKVRLEPYLVESICELSRLVRDKGASNSDISGLLFGNIEPGTRTLEALKTFVDVGQHSELARRQRWEKAYKSTAEEAKNDPELSQFEIVGWFSFRTGSGLLNSDVVFHNQHFRNPEDLALIIWREGPSQITTEVYSKSNNDTLTAEDYRWGSVRLSADIRHMRESVELAMRMKLINEDPFMQAYGDEPSSHLASFKRLFSFLHKEKDEPLNSDIRGLISDGRPNGRSRSTIDAIEPVASPQNYFNPYADAGVARKRVSAEETGQRESAPDAAVPMVPAQLMGQSISQTPAQAAVWPGQGSGLGTAPARISEPSPGLPPDSDFPLTLSPNRPLDLGQIGRAPRTGRLHSDEISGLPMLLRQPANRNSTQWPWVIGLFMICSTLVFGVLAMTGLQSDGGRVGQAIQSLFPGSELNLRIHNEDDRLRLSWNQRNKTVASATDATLQIIDGQTRRDVRLDGRQVADGSVLYRPLTNDITFRLEVHGEKGATSGSVRVLDGLSSRQSTLDVSAPAGAAQNLGQSASNATPPANSSGLPAGQPAAPTPEPVAASTVPPMTGIAVVSVPSAPRPVSRAAASQKPTPTHYETPDTIDTIQPNRGSTINGWDPAPTKDRSRSRALSTATTTTNFLPARPLIRVMPNMRNIPAGTIQARTRVSVQVNVDQTGHVTFARVASGSVNTKVSAAALSAARQWTFDPAKSNGRHVNSEHTIVFEFPAR